MRIIAYTLGAAFFFAQIATALPAQAKDGSVWTQLCTSGTWVKLDFGNNNETPERPSHIKACHALCCSEEEGGSPCALKDKT